MIGEHAHHGVGHLGGVGRAHHHAGLARKVLVSGDAAEHQPEPDAPLDAEAVLHLDRLEADVVGVLERGDDAAAVIGDVELARQAVERALVEDMEVPLARIRPRIEQFLRVDAGGGRTRDVADVVGAGAARAQAEIGDRFEHRDRVLRRDLADLDVGAGGDVGVAAAVLLGEIGEARELPVLEDAVRNPQAAHVRALRRRDVEQAVVAPAEIVRRLRRFVLLGLLLQPAIGVERMLLALELLLLVELAAGFDGAVLRANMIGIGARRFGGTGRAAAGTRRPCHLQAGGEALQVSFLFWSEIAGHCTSQAASTKLCRS